MKSMILVLILAVFLASSCGQTAPTQSSAVTPGKTTGTTSSSTTSKPSPSPKTLTEVKSSKKLSTARDNYEMAIKEAHQWQADAKFMELHADNTSASLRIESIDKIALAGLKEAPMNGTAETWEYTFMSQNAKVPYQVEITNGSIVKSKEAAMFLPRPYESMKDISDWLVDSPEAITIAKTKVSQDISNGAFITYAMFNGRDIVKVMEQVYVNRYRWQITIRPYKQKVTVIEIDGTTKEIFKVTELN